MERKIIFGVFDKTIECGSYIGFFENEDDAKKELNSQMNYAQLELGYSNMTLKEDRVTRNIDDKEIIVYVIHSLVLR